MAIAKVEPLTTARALRGPFDYRIPEGMDGVGVGTVLEVPFGRRSVIGVVVEVGSRSEVPPERLADPVRALGPGLPEELLALGLRVAQEYCSTPARGLGLVLPPGTGTRPSAPARPRRVLRASLTEAGYDALSAETRLGERQRAALDALAAGSRSAAELTRATGCASASLRALERRGLVELREVEPERPRAAVVGARGPADATLTPAQERALAAVVARMDAPQGSDRRLLLHGVTGSGKTEVYLRAAQAALERGRGAIVLVPEIALTPQTAGRFAERFGDRVAILHSRLGSARRRAEWARLREGAARVCVGPRSAVFAPVEEVGLVVVDEEHDASYKQEGDPRYDARRVAELRAAAAGAALVVGSATPRPESWHRLTRVEMPERVDSRPMPTVELLGMAGVEGPIHPRAREALDEVRAVGGKAIVLLNRRGWSNFLSCRGCGRAWGCPSCDVTLVLHRSAGTLACHHCGHSERVPAACPDCGSASVARHGSGTERLERELELALAPLPVLRLDSDASGREGAPERILERFGSLGSGVLVGTQMVAKGHDFPDVRLGIVVDADATLRFPDFRAEERTFALVAQLAGRAGRGTADGRVLVQAMDPEASPLRYAAAHDAPGFLEEELARRAALRYPPFGTLVRIVLAAAEAPPATRAAAAVASALLDGLGSDGSVLGPAPLFRRAGRKRVQLVVKAGTRDKAVRTVRGAVEEVAADRVARGVSFAVDVDPQ